MKEFIEPTLIKAGDPVVLLGGLAAAVDCRVIKEENYQRLKRAFDTLLILDVEIRKQRKVFDKLFKDAEDKEIDCEEFKDRFV